MGFEVLLPTDALAEYISGYFLVENDFEGNEEIKIMENGTSLGIGIGKPFEFTFQKEDEELGEFEKYDKIYVFNNIGKTSPLYVKGKVVLFFVVLTPLGYKYLSNGARMNFPDDFFPLSRLGVPAFNLIIKRKLRFCQDTMEGIKVIEKELCRYFLKLKNVPEEGEYKIQDPFLGLG
jgi:hypothetical protein